LIKPKANSSGNTNENDKKPENTIIVCNKLANKLIVRLTTTDTNKNVVIRYNTSFDTWPDEPNAGSNQYNSVLSFEKDVYIIACTHNIISGKFGTPEKKYCQLNNS